MNYKEAREFVNETTKYGSVLGLENIRVLLKLLDNPQDKIKIVHIAGTNGKGSIFTFVQSVLLEAGINVGRYSSPAVFHYREIISYNGKVIEKDEFAQYASIVKHACDKMVMDNRPHPTAFEIETAIAYLYFADKSCDIVLIETGMGGETDATNVEKSSLCSVISSISLDHMQFLGDTVEEIAKVKSGIIKENGIVITSKQDKKILDIIRKVAEEKNNQFIVANDAQDFVVNGYETSFQYYSAHGRKMNITINMMGAYQIVNACTAIEALLALRDKGYEIKDKHIYEGMKNAVWPGRMEIINENPLIVIDGAHNPAAANMLRETIEMYFTNKRIAFIMGVLADKDYREEAKITATYATNIFTITPDNKRALNGEKLAETISAFNKNVQYISDLREAVDVTMKMYQENKIDMILAFGSLSYLGDLKKIINDANS